MIAIKRAYDDRGITIPLAIRTLDFDATGGEPLRAVLGDGETPVRRRGTLGDLRS